MHAVRLQEGDWLQTETRAAESESQKTVHDALAVVVIEHGGGNAVNRRDTHFLASMGEDLNVVTAQEGTLCCLLRPTAGTYSHSCGIPRWGWNSSVFRQSRRASILQQQISTTIPSYRALTISAEISVPETLLNHVAISLLRN